MEVPVIPSFSIPDTEVPARVRRNRRRRVSPQAGRALQVLGHAIEYLTDEFMHCGAPISARDARIQAVQLLMALNRQIYFECPAVPTMSERCRTFLHLPKA
jgi:hypothetical protein